jgi:hypothetical protein
VVSVVGRERELSLAEEFLDSAGERFSVLVVEGEAGIGKTTVWAGRSPARGEARVPRLARPSSDRG